MPHMSPYLSWNLLFSEFFLIFLMVENSFFSAAAAAYVGTAGMMRKHKYIFFLFFLFFIIKIQIIAQRESRAVSS